MTETLAQLADEYIKPMTSIRGRRIRRLIMREFAGADKVMIVADGRGRPSVLGSSASGAAICTSDGKGPSVCVIKWLHGADEGVEVTYDLLKDSLPELSTAPVHLPKVELP